MASRRTPGNFAFRGLRSGVNAPRLRRRNKSIVGIGIEEYKSIFFQDAPINSAVDRAAYKANSAAAAFVRKIARDLLSERGVKYHGRAGIPAHILKAYDARLKKWWALGGEPKFKPHLPHRSTAPPGSPPFQVVGLIKKHVYFGVLKNERSAIIGPAYLRRARPKGSPSTVPEIHEHGAPGLQRIPGGGGRAVVKFPERPYMKKALLRLREVGMERFWRDQVKPTSVKLKK